MLFEDITLIDDRFQVRTHQYLQTEGCRIAYIGPDCPPDYRGERYNGHNKALVPGFFNLHCHLPDTVLRGFGEGLPLHRWLQEKMFPFEARMTGEDCYWSTLLGVCELIRGGAVSVTDMFLHLDDVERAVRESGLKANLTYGLTAAPDGRPFEEMDGVRETLALRDHLARTGDGRIRADMGLHAEYTATEPLMRQVAELCRSEGFRLHLHLSETRKEQEECRQRHGGLTPAALFERCGLFDTPVTAAHCVWLEGEDFDILRDRGVTVAHNPSSNLKLGSGIAPVKKMLDKGIRVAIGTDSAASNNNLNMLEEMNLASMLQKGLTGDPTCLGPSEILEMTCRTGALAQGREDCGAIKVGNRADLLVFDLDKPHLQPVHDLLSNLLYAASASDICLSMIDGDVVYKDGQLTHLDEEKIIAEANRRTARILSEL